MKNLTIISSVLFAFSTLVARGEEPAPARSTAQVTLRVEMKNIRAEKEKKSADDKKEKDKPKAETTGKSLEVEVSAAKSINGPIKLVTTWYARDNDTKEQVVANTEEGEVALDAAKTAKFTGKPCSFTSTPAHSAKGADGKTEKVRASGQTFAGWVIRGYEGTTLVGEAASSPTLLKLPK
ncbi:MAG: hypothetical protein V4819_23450 [Verrucomicrobiota bacterium]